MAVKGLDRQRDFHRCPQLWYDLVDSHFEKSHSRSSFSRGSQRGLAVVLR